MSSIVARAQDTIYPVYITLLLLLLLYCDKDNSCEVQDFVETCAVLQAVCVILRSREIPDECMPSLKVILVSSGRGLPLEVLRASRGIR